MHMKTSEPQSRSLARLLVIGGVFAASTAFGQVVLNTPTYSQNFDALANSTSNSTHTWANNSTVTGWYAVEFGSTAPVTPSTYTVFPNAVVTGGSTLYSLGSASASDRALGLRNGGAVVPASIHRIGMQLTNSLGATVIGFQLSYDGEQWHTSSAGAKSLEVEYSFNATSLNTGTWTSISGLAFNAPVTLQAADANLNGNLPANRVAGLTGNVSSISWANGSALWVRWSDTAITGNDHILGIDDVSFTATVIPEPSATAALAGAALLAFAALRRRR